MIDVCKTLCLFEIVEKYLTSGLGVVTCSCSLLLKMTVMTKTLNSTTVTITQVFHQLPVDPEPRLDE